MQVRGHGEIPPEEGDKTSKGTQKESGGPKIELGVTFRSFINTLKSVVPSFMRPLSRQEKIDEIGNNLGQQLAPDAVTFLQNHESVTKKLRKLVKVLKAYENSEKRVGGEETKNVHIAKVALNESLRPFQENKIPPAIKKIIAETEIKTTNIPGEEESTVQYVDVEAKTTSDEIQGKKETGVEYTQVEPGPSSPEEPKPASSGPAQVSTPGYTFPPGNMPPEILTDKQLMAESGLADIKDEDKGDVVQFLRSSPEIPGRVGALLREQPEIDAVIGFVDYLNHDGTAIGGKGREIVMNKLLEKYSAKSLIDHQVVKKNALRSVISNQTNASIEEYVEEARKLLSLFSALPQTEEVKDLKKEHGYFT